MKIFIPIKEQSVRVPCKNFRVFGKYPLWEHTLRKLKDFEVYVDTDMEGLFGEIFANDLAHVSYRPEHLCGNDVSVNKLIGNFLDKEVEDENELIIQIHVTSPFLKVETLKEVENSFSDDKCDSIVSCTQIRARFWRAEERYGKYGTVFIPINHNPTVLEPTQNMNAVYMENSLFYVFTKRSFQETGNRIGKRPCFWAITYPENLDIDTEEDWELCDLIRKSQSAPIQ